MGKYADAIRAPLAPHCRDSQAAILKVLSDANNDLVDAAKGRIKGFSIVDQIPRQPRAVSVLCFLVDSLNDIGSKDVASITWGEIPYEFPFWVKPHWCNSPADLQPVFITSPEVFEDWLIKELSKGYLTRDIIHLFV